MSNTDPKHFTSEEARAHIEELEKKVAKLEAELKHKSYFDLADSALETRLKHFNAIVDQLPDGDGKSIAADILEDYEQLRRERYEFRSRIEALTRREQITNGFVEDLKNDVRYQRVRNDAIVAGTGIVMRQRDRALMALIDIRDGACGLCGPNYKCCKLAHEVLKDWEENGTHRLSEDD